VESKAGRQAILSKRVVDCTGDGDLLYRAGVEFTYGRESDHKARPFVLMFRIGGLDVKKMMDYLKEHPSEWESKHRVDPLHKIGNEHVYTRVSGFTDLVAKAKQNGDLYDDIHSLRLEALMIERGIAQVNTTRIYYVDGTNPVDLTKGEIMGRWQMEKVVAIMRNYVPGGENTYVLDVAPMIGVRETRRFRGEYFLTNEDAHNDMSFEDNIMLVEIKLPPLSLLSIVDVHPVEPIEGSEKDLWTRDDPNAQLEKRSFHFNYRMLLPQGIDNMLYAGRTMPTTHAVEAFVREMPLCMRMGQVAGTAAAISVTHNVSPKKLEYSLLKNALLKQGYTRF
jgi:hypothetical protein